MSTIKKVLLLLLVIVIIIFTGTILFNNYVEQKVKGYAVDTYDAKIAEVNVNLWKRTIAVDSLSYGAMNSEVNRIELHDINWLSLIKQKEGWIDNLALKASKFNYWTADSLYQLKFEKVNSVGGQIIMNNVIFTTPYNDVSFHQQSEFRQPRISFSFPQIKIQGLSLENKSITKITASEYNIDIDENLNRPASEIKKQLPVALIQNIEQEIHIDSIQLKGGYIKYSVIGEGSTEKGSITLGNVDLRISPVSSLDTIEEMIIELNCRIGDGNVSVTSRNFLKHPHSKYDLYSKIENLDFKELNSISSAMKSVVFKSGTIQDLVLEGSFDDHNASGQMSIKYEKFALNFQNDAIGAKTLISNALTQKSNDEMIEFSSQRNKNRSFIFHIMQSLTTSLKKALLIV